MILVITTLENLYHNQKVLDYGGYDFKFVIPGNDIFNHMELQKIKGDEKVASFFKNISNAKQKNFVEVLGGQAKPLIEQTNEWLIQVAVDVKKMTDRGTDLVQVFPKKNEPFNETQKVELEANQIEIFQRAYLNQEIFKRELEEKAKNPIGLAKEGHVLAEVVIAVLILIFLVPLWNFRTAIVSFFNVPVLIALCLIGAIAAFFIREKFRLIYGTVEFGIGALSIAYAFLRSHRAYDFAFFLGVMAGIYVCVRGQDNLVKGLKKKTKFSEWLRKLGIGQ